MGDFYVNSGEAFTFDFSSTLDLFSEIDHPGIETASAIGSISFGLFDSTDPDNLRLLDVFELVGSLSTPDNGDFLDAQFTPAITLNQDIRDQQFGLLHDFAFASLTGSFHRSFADETYLTLIELKQGGAEVKAVPEPSGVFGSIAAVGLMVLLRKKLGN